MSIFWRKKRSYLTQPVFQGIFTRDFATKKYLNAKGNSYFYLIWSSGLFKNQKSELLFKSCCSCKKYMLWSYSAWIVSKYRVFSSPYLPVFSPKTGKYGPEKTLYLDTFHAVLVAVAATTFIILWDFLMF